MVLARSAVRCASSRVLVGCPRTLNSPLVGRSSRPITFKSVLLPDPEGPMSAAKSDRRSTRSNPCKTSACVGWPTLYDLRTSERRNTSSLPRSDMANGRDRIETCRAARGYGCRKDADERCKQHAREDQLWGNRDFEQPWTERVEA